MAVTLDDLPLLGGPPPGETTEQTTDRLLAALARHRAPATGFVTCRGDRDGAALRRWLRAGLDLGNHTTTHQDIESQRPAAWEADVLRCTTHLRERLGHRARWFRYPMLHQGLTVARRDLAAATIERLGLTHAPVSVDVADWVLVRPYLRAVATRDDRARAAIGRAFQDHVLAAVAHYRAVARARVGREVSQVLLVHASALAADHLGPLLSVLERQGMRFVSLEAALADPVYRRPDGYAGPLGMSWLYRMAPAQPEAWRWDRAAERALTARFAAGPGR